MGTPEAETVSEADRVISALISDEGTREAYDGKADYFLVDDIGTRMDRAAISSGMEFYTEDLKPFEAFDDDAETAVAVFYNVEAGSDLSMIAEEAGVSENYASSILSNFEDDGLVEKRESKADREFFYGEHAHPYLMILEDAKRIIEDYKGEEDDGSLEEPLEDKKDGETDNGQTEDADEQKDYQDILIDVADSEEDLIEVEEQEENVGIETRDHVDSEEEEGSNPGEDEYYEGW